MKKLFLLIFVATVVTSCATKKLPPDTVLSYWSGKDILIAIMDTSGKEVYQPVYLKHASKRKLRKISEL